MDEVDYFKAHHGSMPIDLLANHGTEMAERHVGIEATIQMYTDTALMRGCWTRETSGTVHLLRISSAIMIEFRFLHSESLEEAFACKKYFAKVFGGMNWDLVSFSSISSIRFLRGALIDRQYQRADSSCNKDGSDNHRSKGAAGGAPGSGAVRCLGRGEGAA